MNKLFKHNRHKGVGIGGMRCPCCQPFNTKKEHRRKVRTLNKLTTTNIIKEQMTPKGE